MPERKENRMWEIYDTLIDAIPPDSEVQACLCGLCWFAVRSEGLGIAMAPGEGGAGLPQAGEYAGMRTRDLAQLVKSWNFHEAALGLAAINSAFNSPQSFKANAGVDHRQLPDKDAFDFLIDEVRGKKVAVIGHFPRLERLRDVCELTILERRPQPGDVPDPACEWVLPQQDCVVSTATTLINKTLPRLLELSRHVRFVLVGPSAPLTPKLFAFGIDTLAGLVVEDEARVWAAVQEGAQHQLFQRGSRMVTFSCQTVTCEAE